MAKYIGRKLLMMLPLIWGVVTLIFILLELSPGNIADKFFTAETPPELRELIIAKYGLDQSAFSRYFLMLRNLSLFDFGNSMAKERPVWDLIADRVPNTVLLSVVTMLVAFPTGIVLGIWQGVRQGKPTDTAISITSLFFYSMPAFWLALMLQLICGLLLPNYLTDLAQAGWLPASFPDYFTLPTSNMYDTVQYDYMTGPEQLWDRAKHLILPGIAMGLASAASTARYMRSSLLEVIRQDYVRTARAKGLAERTVILKHALRNALLPIVTLVGLSLPGLFSGAVLVEAVFAWPGMGTLILDAIRTQDTPLIIACFFVTTVLVVSGNLVADIAYAFVDPRIRYD